MGKHYIFFNLIVATVWLHGIGWLIYQFYWNNLTGKPYVIAWHLFSSFNPLLSFSKSTDFNSYFFHDKSIGRAPHTTVHQKFSAIIYWFIICVCKNNCDICILIAGYLTPRRHSRLWVLKMDFSKIARLMPNKCKSTKKLTCSTSCSWIYWYEMFLIFYDAYSCLCVMIPPVLRPTCLMQALRVCTKYFLKMHPNDRICHNFRKSGFTT